MALARGLAGLLWRLTPASPRGEEPVGRLESRWYDVDGMRLHTRVSVGTAPAGAPAVVLVHGLAVSSAYMVPTAVRLAVDLPVYAPDLPGFGVSDTPPRALDVPRLADALVAWMDAAGLDRAVLVGNSLGCQIIVSVAARYPERVHGLVLQGTTVDRYARSFPRQLARLIRDMPREHPTALVVQARDYLRFGLVRTVRTFHYAMRDEIEAMLPLVRAPTLVVHGERDPISSRRWAEEVAGLLPDGRLVTIPGAAHTPNYSTPTAFARVIRRWLGDGGEDALTSSGTDERADLRPDPATRWAT